MNDKLRALVEILVGSQQQCDHDGTMIAVSRQALDELAACLPSEAGDGDKPMAWIRRWAFDGVTVMARTKVDRPNGWQLLPVTRHKLLNDDIPLYTATPPAAEVSLTDAQCDAICFSLSKLGEDVSFDELGLPLWNDDYKAQARALVRTALTDTAALRPFTEEGKV